MKSSSFLLQSVVLGTKWHLQIVCPYVGYLSVLYACPFDMTVSRLSAYSSAEHLLWGRLPLATEKLWFFKLSEKSLFFSLISLSTHFLPIFLYILRAIQTCRYWRILNEENSSCINLFSVQWSIFLYSYLFIYVSSIYFFYLYIFLCIHP